MKRSLDRIGERRNQAILSRQGDVFDSRGVWTDGWGRLLLSGVLTPVSIDYARKQFLRFFVTRIGTSNFTDLPNDLE